MNFDPYLGKIPILTSILVGSTTNYKQPDLRLTNRLELPSHAVTVTTRIIPFLVGNPYKPSFVTVTGWGVDLTNRTKHLQIPRFRRFYERSDLPISVHHGTSPSIDWKAAGVGGEVMGSLPTIAQR